MKKNCIVSFANQKGRYIQNLARLGESLRNNFDGDFLGFIGEGTIGAPMHTDHPYGFKIHAWEKAVDSGYELILWLDSSCFAIKNVKYIFDKINEQGYVFQKAGHYCSTWCNDASLKYHGITRDDAAKMPMIGNAGFLGLNIKSEIGFNFFKMWQKAYYEVGFKGKWDNDDLSESDSIECHGFRHDMSHSSLIANKLGIVENAFNGDELLQYGGLFDEIINSSIILKAQG